jgi:Fe-S-cluster-containing dehydrogenase component
MLKNVFLVMNRCLGCEECVEACKRENGVALCFVDSYHGVPVPFRCAHCEDAPCEKVCPTESITIKDDIVLIDAETCIGCRSCEFICPWGIPVYREDLGKVSKCDMCISRQKLDKDPACVEACPTQALVFGTREEFMADYHETTEKRIEKAGGHASRIILPQEG